MTKAELLDVVLLTQKMFREAMPKLNWAESALDANAIMLLKDTEIAVNRAVRESK